MEEILQHTAHPIQPIMSHLLNDASLLQPKDFINKKILNLAADLTITAPLIQ
jgi:hypothetical protein